MAHYREFADHLIRKIDEQYEVISNPILKGNLDKKDYHRLTGTLHGLNFTRDLIQNTVRQVMKHEGEIEEKTDE